MNPQCYVEVPGQNYYHAHVCQSCGTTWKHRAPVPMTVTTNELIHTCPKCGAIRWEIDYACIDPLDVIFALSVIALATCALTFLYQRFHAKDQITSAASTLIASNASL
jgi:hypothetical protein